MTTLTMRRLLLIISLSLGLTVVPGSAGRPPDSTSFSAFVDGYLDSFARRHPSIAAGNGLHQYDDRLEDFSAAAVTQEIADLKQWRDRLGKIDAAGLNSDERVDHRILGGIIDGWLLDLRTVETWRRNPMIYAAAVTDGVNNLIDRKSVV
jgi:uncharacterized protein (DUF885 family)